MKRKKLLRPIYGTRRARRICRGAKGASADEQQENKNASDEAHIYLRKNDYQAAKGVGVVYHDRGGSNPSEHPDAALKSVNRILF